MAPQLDSVGRSGSTLVTNVRGFIIKNVKNEEEYKLLREAMPAFGKDLFNPLSPRQESKCWRSALAPICAVLAAPDKVQWLAMRKVEIPEAKAVKVNLGGKRADLRGEEIGWLDLKGPKFAHSLRDGKTFFSPPGVWKHKDSGFVDIFPKGAQLGSCGSRDAALVIASDARLLMQNQMTDYSLFAKFYEPPSDGSCVCDGAQHPTFPLLLDVPNHKPPMRLAVAVIDYIEREYSNLKLMSTMKPPDVFRDWWMLMWPSYFQLPKRSLSAETGIVAALDHQPAERFQVGDTVVALMKIKWSETNIVQKPAWGKPTYVVQLEESSSSSLSSGSDHKVSAGERGKIVALPPKVGPEKLGPGLVVVWDSLGERQAFRVEPEQVIGIPRRFEA